MDVIADTLRCLTAFVSHVDPELGEHRVDEPDHPSPDVQFRLPDSQSLHRPQPAEAREAQKYPQRAGNQNVPKRDVKFVDFPEEPGGIFRKSQMNKSETLKLGYAVVLGRLPTTEDLLSHKEKRCLKAARDGIAELMLNPTEKTTALSSIQTEDGGTVADLPSLVTTAISQPYGSLGLDDCAFGKTMSAWYLFQHQAEDFLRGKIDKCRMKHLDTAAERLRIALGCLHWAGVIGDQDRPQFQASFTSALIFDGDATAEMNGETIETSPLDTNAPLEKSLLLQILDAIRQHDENSDSHHSDEISKIETAIECSRDVAQKLGNKKRIQYENGQAQADHIREYNEGRVSERQRQDLCAAVKRDTMDYPAMSTPRPHGYWKDLLRCTPSYASADALRKAVTRKRSEKRGKYPREGKKRGPYKKNWQ